MSERDVIEAYKQYLSGYSLQQLRYQPAEGGWSLSQMYNHLILAALDYLDQAAVCTAVAEQTLGKTEAGEQVFRNGGFPPVKIKLPDGPANSPSNSDSKEELLRGLEQVQRRMAEWVIKLDETNPDCKVKHGGFGWLNAREWYSLVDMHFRHHLRQKSELDRKLGL
ncbi:DinB superfamily protein [Paenibacillus konkukensis]|uniref:DinB superfamily protein n=1 Tax=Paenibacillus konkukensis TaxID=2020716 RepID=A0ABY4RKJ2_9BACL|nr:DinB family protein [Paenibacillus konkukensis]UQZ82989.1 DinB superfamily protein [Paenibacillus konkukensis]